MAKGGGSTDGLVPRSKGPAYVAAVAAIAIATLIAGGMVSFSLLVANFVGWETRRTALVEAVSAWPLIVIVAAVVALVRRLPWTWIAAGALVPLALIAFLAHDEPFVAPPKLESTAHADDPGYLALMWLAKGSPTNRLGDIPDLDSGFSHHQLTLPDDAPARARYVRDNRALIGEAWAQIAVGREWVAELAGHPPAGAWGYRYQEPFLDYRPIRQLVRVTATHAYLSAAEGDADGGLSELTQEIAALQNLQRTGMGLLNQMIAAASLKVAMWDAGCILDDAGPSEKARARLLAVLGQAPPFPARIGNMFDGEIFFMENVLDHSFDLGAAGPMKGVLPRSNSLGYLLLALRPIGFNRNASARFCVESLKDAETLALGRDADGVKRWHPRGAPLLQQLRNPFGRLVTTMALPAVDKGVTAVSESEDRRLSLVRRLQGEGGAGRKPGL